ncbi:MAG: hypothetical protein AAGU11_19840 [Syntrophobacteraceae bacterium]
MARLPGTLAGEIIGVLPLAIAKGAGASPHSTGGAFADCRCHAGGIRQPKPADASGAGSAVMTDQHSARVGIGFREIDFFGPPGSLNKRALEEFLATEHARRGRPGDEINSVLESL